MDSDANHTMNRSMDDFFTSKQYKGDIYKTTNLQNLSLASYCETDSAMVKEQQRIENELVTFENNLYGDDLKEKPAVAAATTKKVATKAAAVEEEKAEVHEPIVSYARAKQARDTSAGNSKKKGATASSSRTKKSSSSSSTVRASVRRERR